VLNSAEDTGCVDSSNGPLSKLQMPPDSTHWTVWLAVLAYFASLAIGIAHRDAHSRPRTADSWQRIFWTLGCLFTWIHVVCAFAQYHHWSHHAAYAHTEQESARKVGVAWGGGIYFNYLFLFIWTADVAWWWFRPTAYVIRPRGITICVHLYLAFIAFNATVVFGAGFVRYASVGAIVVLFALSWRSGNRRD
jgi:hypothetical protein